MKFRALHFFCGIGGKAIGFAHAVAAHGDVEATFETIGGIDFDELACRDFEMLTGAPALCADVHELEPADLLRFAGPVAPDVVAMSPPCKGLSGLLSERKAAEDKYQRMNTLMHRALLLVSATWETPPKLIFVENVPRMQSRGRDVVRKSVAILEAHGYAVAMGSHDCGELGGLAQHRQRWFLVARHRQQVPQFVYQPRKHRVRACGEVLGPLPMPGDVENGGPMHTVPNLSWRNWLRLAMIPAGGDWRDLPNVLKEGQQRREVFRRDPVTPWESPADTVTGPGGSASTNVADPRVEVTCSPRAGAYGVVGFDDPAGTITGSMQVDNGPAAVADPRFTNIMQVNAWDRPARTVVGARRPGGGAPSVADPRFADGKKKNWQQVAGVTSWIDPAPTITSGASIHAGAFQVADPRVLQQPRYRIMTLDEALALDLPLDKAPPWIPVIVAADGTWHRPMTTLELGVLQSLPPTFEGKPLVLATRPGSRGGHTRWREAIGNCVPPLAALAVGEQLLQALVIAALGAFSLSNNDIWVAPSREALAV